MSETQSKLLERLRARVARLDRVEPDETDERDEVIARLERELEDERNNAAALRKKIDEQAFRIEVLERSYSKQLDDARARAEQTEAALGDQKARVSELEALRDTLTSERDAVQKELEQRTRRERAGMSLGPDAAPAHGMAIARPAGNLADRDVSIDEMLADASVVDSRDRADAHFALNGPTAAAAPPDDEAALEDMLSPDLVFDDGDSRDD